jgi:hypothetical protein
MTLENPRSACPREILIDLGGCEAWATIELHSTVTIEAERRRRTTVETLSIEEMQARYPVLAAAVAEEVAMMIRSRESAVVNRA